MPGSPMEGLFQGHLPEFRPYGRCCRCGMDHTLGGATPWVFSGLEF